MFFSVLQYGITQYLLDIGKSDNVLRLAKDIQFNGKSYNATPKTKLLKTLQKVRPILKI